MGALQTLYEAPCRFYVGDNRPLRIRWYWAQDGAQVGPHPTRFWEGIRYEQTSPRPAGGTGESSGPDRTFGEWPTPPWQTGTEPAEGTEDDFRGLSPLPSGPITPPDCSELHHPWLQSKELLTLSPFAAAPLAQVEDLAARVAPALHLSLDQVEDLAAGTAAAAPARMDQVEELAARTAAAAPARMDQVEALTVAVLPASSPAALDQVETVVVRLPIVQLERLATSSAVRLAAFDLAALAQVEDLAGVPTGWVRARIEQVENLAATPVGLSAGAFIDQVEDLAVSLDPLFGEATIDQVEDLDVDVVPASSPADLDQVEDFDVTFEAVEGPP